MKVCLVELMPFPYTLGGGTTHIMNLGRALVDLGNEVHVISSRPAKFYKKLAYDKRIIVHNVGMRHKRFEGAGRFYYLYRFAFEVSFILGARKIIGSIKPDIIDCQSSITTALPASLSSYPFVITCHGIHSEGFSKLYSSKNRSLTANFLNSIYFAITKYNISKARKLISQGKVTLNYYSSLIGSSSKEVLVPNLVATDFWKPSSKKENNLICAVARFTKQKALDKLVLAMKDINELKLIIAGGGEMETELKSLAGKNISFPGYYTPEQCLRLYRKARFNVLPSEFEGLPYAILESMSCGVIPITTKVGDLQTLIKDGKNGFLLKDNKPQTIAKTIRMAYSKKTDKISLAARQTIIDNYSLHNVAKIFLKTYREVAK